MLDLQVGVTWFLSPNSTAMKLILVIFSLLQGPGLLSSTPFLPWYTG